MSFIHLRTHTEYSVVDGILRIDALCAAAHADQQGALAITDLSNLFGAVKFYQACRGMGVKPLIGVDVWLEPLPGAGDKAPSRLLLLAQDHAGYLHLCELLARGWVSNSQRAQAWLKWDWLGELGGGLIALSGADGGAVGMALLAGDGARASAVATRLSALFPHRFYLELQRAGLPTNEAHVRAAVPLAAALGLPVVATHPVQFQTPDDFDAHEARVCVADGELLANPRRTKRFTREQHFKTQAQMRDIWADVPSALANTVQIARRCSLNLVLGKAHLPDFPTPLVDGARVPIDTYFRQESHAGLERRLATLYPDVTRRDAERPRYLQRLEFEIETIVKMGFPGYFLIVSDFIVWAKSHGCPVGPGRGSGAGSLVAYSLFVTDLDPLQYRLLFERFLNPERVSMPDFDIDFCMDRRDEVIDYVAAKYGRDRVSQIITYGTMSSKAVVRDTGRVLGYPYGFVDGIAKLIPLQPADPLSLEDVLGRSEKAKKDPGRAIGEFVERYNSEDDFRELIDLALELEDLTRNAGKHAGECEQAKRDSGIARLEHEEVKRGRQARKVGQNALEPPRRHETDADTGQCADAGENHTFRDDLSHDAALRDADGTQHGNLAGTFVDADGDQRGHEQHTDRQRNAAEHQGELLEVTKSLLDGRCRAFKGDGRHAGADFLHARSHNFRINAVCGLHHYERHTITSLAAAHRLQHWKQHCQRGLGCGDVEEARDATHHEAPLTHDGPQLRIVADGQQDCVTEHVARGGKPAIIRDEARTVREIRATQQLVVALHIREEAQREGTHVRVDGRRGLHLGAEYRADGSDALQACNRRDERRRAVDRRVAVERQCALRCDAQLIALEHQESLKVLAHAGREHHHVEQQRGRHRDTKQREQGARRMTPECKHRETNGHQRPSNVSAGTRTSRRAANHPATIPSSTESRQANTTVSGVTSVKANVVRCTP